jgi:hypothetical protein
MSLHFAIQTIIAIIAEIDFKQKADNSNQFLVALGPNRVQTTNFSAVKGVDDSRLS